MSRFLSGFFGGLLMAFCAYAVGSFLGGCGNVPVVPVVNPPVVPPVVPPDNPPVTTGQITDSDYAAVDEDSVGTDGVVRNGTSEANMILRLGAPFRKAVAAGITTYTYVYSGSTKTAFFLIVGGKVVHKFTKP